MAAEVDGVALTVDLADPDAASALAGRAAEALGGPVEIFVHSAGVASIAPLHQLAPEDWRRSFAVNVDAAFHISRDLMKPMKEAGWGRIVTIASLRARVGVPTTAAYTASKHALLGLTRVISAELATSRRHRQRGGPRVGGHADGARRDRQLRRRRSTSPARRPSGACCASRRSGASCRPTRSPAWSATCAASRPAG